MAVFFPIWFNYAVIYRPLFLFFLKKSREASYDHYKKGNKEKDGGSCC